MTGLIIMIIMGFFIIWVIIQARIDIKKRGIGLK